MYLIRSAYRRGQPLTTKQRTSSFFTEEPRVGTHIVRLDHPLRFTDAELEAHEADLKRLLEAEAIEIVRLSEDGSEAPVVPPQAPPTVPSGEAPTAPPTEPPPATEPSPPEPPAESAPSEPPPAETNTETAEEPAPAAEPSHPSAAARKRSRKQE
jgi:hypothetical protein